MSASPSHVPVLPVEIMAAIIDKASERSQGGRLSKEQLSSLGACALTCKLFLDLARPHIFRRLDIYFDKDDGERLLRLMTILVRGEPILKTQITEVYIHLRSLIPDEDPFKALKRRKIHPSNLPAVQLLSVIDGYFYTENGRPIRRGTNHSPWLLNFCCGIIHSYISLPTFKVLRFEDNGRSQEVPFSVLLKSPGLTVTDLYLVDIRSPSEGWCDFTRLIPPLKRLQRLTLENCSHHCTSLLSKTPALSELALWHVHNVNIADGIPPPPPPPIRLTKLELKSGTEWDTPSSLSTAFDLLWRNSDLGFKPIAWLESLIITIAPQEFDELHVINKMFEGLKNLTSLTIDLGASNSITFTDLELDRHLRSSFPSLTSLSISILDLHYIRQLFTVQAPVMDSLIAMLDSIRSVQRLRSLKIDVSDVDLCDSDSPVFLSITSILSISSSFDSLEVVEIAVVFSVARDANRDSPLDLRILSDEALIPQIQKQVQQMERQNEIRLHLHFSSIVIPPRSLKKRPVPSRTAFITFYPRQRVS